MKNSTNPALVAKKIIFTFFLAQVACAGTIFASNTSVGGIWYNFNNVNLTAEVTYRGNAYNSYYGEYSDVVTIPSLIIYNEEEYSVTSIGERAFYGCDGLTSVTIPSSVTNIGSEAFYDCSGMIGIDVAAENPNYSSEEGVLFNKDKTTLLIYPGSKQGAYVIPNSVTSIRERAFKDCSGLTSIEIPNSVTSIGEGAFYWCIGLTSVIIPNSVTTIGNESFFNCTDLSSVTIPNSVTSIGEEAFYYCKALTSLTIPNSVESIGSSAFGCCSDLTSVTIPNSVTSIGSSAFKYCSGLTSIEIPNGITSIGEEAFSYCSNITKVTWNAKNSNGFNFGSQVESFTFGEEVEVIPANLCSGMNKLTSIEIPYNVTSIGVQAFYGCSNIIEVTWNARNSSGYFFGTQVESFTFGDEVEVIPARICSNMSKLSLIFIPNSVTSIGNSAFSACSGLTSIEIPNSVTSIENYAFYGCSGLTSINIKAETSPSLGSNVFSSSNNCPLYVPCGTIDAYKKVWSEYTDRIKYVPLELDFSIDAQVNDEAMGSVLLPQTQCDGYTLKAIPNGGYHFVQWSDGNTNNPRIIELTKDTTFIAEFAINTSGVCGKDNALSWVYQIENATLTISGNGELTENYTFNHLKNEIEKLVLSDQVTKIGYSTFMSCLKLNSVTIPNSITSIGDHAFFGCSNITEVIWNARNSNGFNFGSQVESFIFGEEVEVIPDNLCSGMNKLTSMTIPNSVTSIGIAAFSNCSQIKEITIPSSVTSIGESAFSYGNRLETIILGENVESIGVNVFANCPYILNVYAQMEYPPIIDASVFANCGDLSMVDLFVHESAIKRYQKTDVWRIFNLQAGDAPEPLHSEYTITYLDKDHGFVDSENIKLNVPEAPHFDGFTFLRWETIAADIETGITIQAVYEADVPSAAPEVYTNPANPAQKLIRNGNVYILRGDKTYTLQGQEVK